MRHHLRDVVPIAGDLGSLAVYVDGEKSHVVPDVDDTDFDRDAVAGFELAYFLGHVPLYCGEDDINWTSAGHAMKYRAVAITTAMVRTFSDRFVEGSMERPLKRAASACAPA